MTFEEILGLKNHTRVDTRVDDRCPPKPEPQPIKIGFKPNYIKAIYVDEVEKVVVVRFVDGGKEIVKCGEHDEFDVSVGVALGIARHLFGNHTQFYKHVVEKKTVYVKKKDDELVNVGDKEYDRYVAWCKKNHKRLASYSTFKKNKNKYLAKTKGEK